MLATRRSKFAASARRREAAYLRCFAASGDRSTRPASRSGPGRRAERALERAGADGGAVVGSRGSPLVGIGRARPSDALPPTGQRYRAAAPAPGLKVTHGQQALRARQTAPER